jgi:hypothetical protein
VAGRSGIPIAPAEERSRGRMLDDCREALGVDPCERHLAVGAQWSIDDAVSRVLDPAYIVV